MMNILKTTYKDLNTISNIGYFSIFVNFTYIDVYNYRIGYCKLDKYKNKWIKN